MIHVWEATAGPGLGGRRGPIHHDIQAHAERHARRGVGLSLFWREGISMGKNRVVAGLAVVVALAVGVAVGGCSRLSSWWNTYPQHEVERQDEAGESHVAVLSVATWEDYVQRL